MRLFLVESDNSYFLSSAPMKIAQEIVGVKTAVASNAPSILQGVSAAHRPVLDQDEGTNGVHIGVSSVSSGIYSYGHQVSKFPAILVVLPRRSHPVQRA